MTVDALTDVAGVRVGHATRTGGGWLTGTTVVLAPEGGAVAAVDVRGGGPGTKETDALDPRNLVRKVDAIVLTGGSAYGLDAASGVMAWLEERGRGVRVGADPAHVVPVVPAACVFDLGRGGDFRARPDAATGRAAVEAAAASEAGVRVPQGCVGAGAGATVGPLKGGVGTASTVLGSGITVAALVVANAAGAVTHPETGVLYGELFQGRVAYPEPHVHEAALRRLTEAAGRNTPPPLNTTLAVVATDADLSKAQAQKMAGTAHDGIARAVRPVHLLHDGDTVFALATGTRSLGPADPGSPGSPVTDPDVTDQHVTDQHVTDNPLALNEILAAAADTVTRAIVHAVRAAEPVDGPGGAWPSYGELYGHA
ncbi:L-aminopeptidase/D-esterase-like protein [Streptomyces sp. LBL]|uniref:P1 family peptidase n=1 Tax=Streptomyces sp. LBL TaxID=2940562 RepID=UPI002475EEDA|nr:P1 family peptidase [Streptomyces sp. LBL]MDH6627933.1 L-aminopeptidase/D-esterase-like protein [Streptomyces sp. LBL]